LIDSNSVCSSVTRRYCVKTNELRMMASSQLGSPLHPVFADIRVRQHILKESRLTCMMKQPDPSGIGIWDLPTHRSLAHLLLDTGVIQHIWLGVNNTAVNLRLW